MGRPLSRHINNEELHALVPSRSEAGHEEHGLSSARLRESEAHVRSCPECSSKLRKYCLLVNPIPPAKPALPGIDCPEDIDWYELAAGLWPESTATQLMMHAALCEHCGPQLRAATRLDCDPTPQEERLLAELKTPSRPDASPPRRWHLSFDPFMKWLVPAVAVVVIAAMLGARSLSRAPLSGPQFAEFAVDAHRQHEHGSLALDIHSDSQQALNEWLEAKSRLPLVLPVSPAVIGEASPYRLDGARLLQVGGKNAVFIAYQPQPTHLHAADTRTGEASLVVVPDSVAIASAGVVAHFEKITFHYAIVERYRVVTWSQHGLTYALVSQEGNSTQRSCMVCHSVMKDRDLSQTPTPLGADRAPVEPLLQ